MNDDVCTICGAELCPCCGACTNRDCEIYKDPFALDESVDDFLESKDF